MTALDVLWEYRVAFLHGFLTTFKLVILSAIGGTTIAVFLEWTCHSMGNGLRRIVDWIAFGMSAIPPLVTLFWLHYPAQALLGVVIPPFWTALGTLGLINALAVYRILAEAIQDFPKQFIATGLVSGMSRAQVVRYIQAPLILRVAAPRWIDQQVAILQTSVFASLISVEETFRVSQRINSVEYRPVLIYTAMALVFLTTAGSAMYYARYLRLRSRRDYSER